MRIGLMRHYKVRINNAKKWMNADDFANWVKQYDQSDIYMAAPVRATVDWDACYSSDMSRAIKTAESMHSGEVIKTSRLREIGIYPLFESNVKLPLPIWLIFGRLGWLVNHRTQENKHSTSMRAKTILNEVEENNEGHHNVLIVSHGAFMTVLQRELFERGYTGDRFLKPRNGKLYTYTKVGREP